MMLRFALTSVFSAALVVCGVFSVAWHGGDGGTPQFDSYAELARGGDGTDPRGSAPVGGDGVGPRLLAKS